MRIWYEWSAATKLKTAHAVNKDSENNRTVERNSIGDIDLKFKTKKTLPRQGSFRILAGTISGEPSIAWSILRTFRPGLSP